MNAAVSQIGGVARRIADSLASAPCAKPGARLALKKRACMLAVFVELCDERVAGLESDFAAEKCVELDLDALAVEVALIIEDV